MNDLAKMMWAWGKWSMYFSALLFLVIGAGALAIAIVPGVDEWFAESILDLSGAPDDQFLIDAITDEGAVGSTMLIIGLTFLPCAALFWWCGRWFKQLADGKGGFFGGGAFGVPMGADAVAQYQQVANQYGVPTYGAPQTGTPPAAPQAGPSATPPSPSPSDPSAGGIIT